MEQGISPSTIAEIEQALSQVADIRAARVVSTDEGVIQEIHILASPDKSPKQLVRDIESTIMARFGIPIDHRTVSIAQLGRDVEPMGIACDQPRAHLLRERRGHGRARVGPRQPRTRRHDLPRHRRGPRVDDRPPSPHRAGDACRAVEQYAEGGFGFALEDVALIALGRERVAVSCVILVTPLGEQPLAGTALARTGENESIVRATLDAINRRLNFLTTP